jgi:glycerol-3-phosphate dehydrogenase (NAD(P)+)
VTGPLGIVGAGAFGTAIADVVASHGNDVVLHGDDPEVVAQIESKRVNEKRLPGVTIAPNVRVTGDLREVARAARLILLAVPSTRVVETARRLGEVLDGRHLLVHAVGAPAGEGTAVGESRDIVRRRVSELLREETPVRRIGVLGGPALAQDLAARKPCAVVIASAFDEVIAQTRQALGLPPSIRAYGSHDLLGVELASALSGALTVAVGLADGLGVGNGPRAVLVCRGVAEMTRILGAVGASERTFGGLAGLGNLLVRTSPPSSEHSGDYQLGRELARGGGGAKRETEGTRAAQSARGAARAKGVRTPILDAVASVVYEGVPVKQAAARLMESSGEEE